MRHAVVQAAGALGGIRWRDAVRRTGRAAALGFAGTILMIGGASTQPRIAALPPDAATAVETGPAARPVAAWTEFCRRMPAECDVDTRELATIAMNTALWRTLASVNRRVNARIRPITDQAHWGVVDRWDFPDDGFGDCEDYQLLKRRMLIERGLPRRALRMTVVIDDIGEGHAVLMVRTDRGDFILDNKTNTILSWRNTGYAYIKREGQDGRAWVTLDGGASPVATANR
ncbi:transglutaminase-like cysteine peptidase [Methylobacterium sp. WL30]|uniref:transglutaminase-like cysteine peptidase n=2 Tax=Methylobacterium TaxID=407 RepID=UPI0011C8C353|nr:transglutaminase-like cysteine peptidase [Methylobacterium sp. WL116]TXN25850.1 transglutaminase-like cysteine peptidase [Methylobacterium sp. WL93]TXN45413.1 transglutaminase-like cysteine peptidase [Methylobacterium sp. WL119]TXN63481.1 transglutaminase-like cysteine peptidase [Methylobacterium sp. WL30]